MDGNVADPAVKQEILLADYRPPAFKVLSIKLTFELFDEYATVVAQSEIQKIDTTTSDLVLDGGAYMELESVSLDGRVLASSDYEKTAGSLTVRHVPERFNLCVVTTLKPQENTRLEGLYYSGGNFCTQCEAEGFRHITYFMDRPDVLTCYDVRIEADRVKYPVLLSNGNPGAAGALADGRHFAEWHDPHPKPSYLFALVAGDLACKYGAYKTCSGKTVDLNIYVAASDLAKTDFALAALQRSMKWDEERFGLEYDLDVYNIVAVADFNMGAMENKGLNIFNTKYVLASPETATDADFEHVEGVIGHEYFHNWTGNRVTCRDWFQLSLKEGLTVFRDQEFSSDMGSRSIKRLDDVRLLRMLQFPEDAGPLAHPVRPEKYIEINNFYTATVYNKGAEVIRMLHTFIGPKAFRKGLDLYFERHDGQAVTCEHFVEAMEAASGKDLAQFRLWYSQAGTPQLKVSRERTEKGVSLVVEQSCPATPGQTEKQPAHLPFLVGWLDQHGEPLEPICRKAATWQEGSCLLELTQARQVFSFEGVPDGAVPSFLRNFSAPVRLEDDLTADELAFLMQHDVDSFARWEAGQKLASRVILADVIGESDEAQVAAFEASFAATLASETIADIALVAELLNMPSEIGLGQELGVLLPQAIHTAREKLIKRLAKDNASEMHALYERLAVVGEYSLDSHHKAARRLRNILLVYISRMHDGEDFVRFHYENANNMTDRIAALNIVAQSNFDCRSDILADFYAEWSEEALVVDKWFAAQANSYRHDVVQQVKDLTQHEAFSIKNPNRLRSLVSTFAMLNQFGFHSAGGEGYKFLADMIVKVDALNPQTAARLVAPLGRWSRLEEQPSKDMRAALEWVLEQPGLSDDVRELSSKSLL